MRCCFMEFIPHDYQNTAIQFALDNPAAGLFLDMGMGKTVSFSNSNRGIEKQLP